MPVPQLPPPAVQLQQLAALIGHDAPALGAVASAHVRPLGDNTLLCVAPPLATPSAVAPRLRHGSNDGFVVADMTDVDDFVPVAGSEPPSGVYALLDVRRGDDMRGWSPNEATAALAASGRTPLTLLEGALWVWQSPEVLERNHCFMTAGSRIARPDGRLDARVPAIWISNGTGRDGSRRRGAPKVGWCWANNRHDWLGFASASGRVALTT
jgi:hypothetical protein